jgi:nucleotide-binding universal stress UspA family protein
MIQLKRILVPTDFSAPAGIALRYGCAFVETFDASLHLLHVIMDPFLIPPAGEGYLPPPDYPQHLERVAREQLEKLLPLEWRKQHSVALTCVHGTPFLEIVRYAKEHQMDLIVMGTHGRGVIAHMLMGSVAEKVVRKAPCPVLTVRPQEHEFVMP